MSAVAAVATAAKAAMAETRRMMGMFVGAGRSWIHCWVGVGLNRETCDLCTVWHLAYNVNRSVADKQIENDSISLGLIRKVIVVAFTHGRRLLAHMVRGLL